MSASVLSSLQSSEVVSSRILAPVTVTTAAPSSEKMSGTTDLTSSFSSRSAPASLTTKANSASQPTSQAGASSSLNPVPSSPTRPSSVDAPLTTTSVTIIRGSAPAWTSTITTQPDFTLSTPIALTTTDSKGGNILTTPPLVTIMSTSSETNGSFTIVTHVVANPPIATGSGEQLTTKSSILQNQGAVAGIFISVGIIIASIIAGLVYYYKRNQRIARRNRWLAGMQRQQPLMSLAESEDPFQDPNDQHINTGTAPPMRSLDLGHAFQWDRMDADALLENSVNREYPSTGHAVIQQLHDPEIHLMDTPADDHNVGLAYSTDPPTDNVPGHRHSMTPSTPSIYPSILPLQGDNLHKVGDDFPSVIQRPEDVVNPPPRPPRSHLRESAKKLDYPPLTLTPPGSTSSHTYTNTPSFVSEPRPQDILSRRTILDPRIRSNSP